MCLAKILRLPLALGALVSCTPNKERANFDNLTLPSSPNYYLICPEGYSNAKANDISPVYDVSVQVLQKKWHSMIDDQKRLERFYANDKDLEYSYIARTKWLRFPDTIDVKLISLSPTQSTLALYSRSKYGYSDLGANKKRLENWLEALNEKM